MTISDDEFWRRFDELDGQRIRYNKRREEAFRRLRPTATNWDDADDRTAWNQYCESVERIEQNLAELEKLIWRMG